MRLCLNILRQTDESRAARRRIEHGLQRLGQGGHQLFGVGDPVPVAHHRLKAVVDGHRRLAEVLDLLQHRVGAAVLEGVAGEDQQRQTVGHGNTGSRNHVRRARTDRGGGDHDPPSPFGLGVGNTGEGHALFILPAPGRQLVLHPFQCFGEAGDITVPEDAEHACKHGFSGAVVVGDVLGAHPFYEGLGSGQTFGGHGALLRTPGKPGRISRGSKRNKYSALQNGRINLYIE